MIQKSLISFQSIALILFALSFQSKSVQAATVECAATDHVSGTVLLKQQAEVWSSEAGFFAQLSGSVPGTELTYQYVFTALKRIYWPLKEL